MHQLWRIWALGGHLRQAKKLVKGVESQSDPRPSVLSWEPQIALDEPLLLSVAGATGNHLEVDLRFTVDAESSTT